MSVLWGEAHDDVEVGGEFAGFGVLDGGEVDDEGVADFFVLDAAEGAVVFVAGVAFDVALGGPFLAALDFDGEVDVRGAAGVGDGFDGAEVVAAVGAC